jgi:lipoate---protein ligase
VKPGNLSETACSSDTTSLVFGIKYRRILPAQMKYLDATLSTPAENLACDEAMLDEAEQNGGEWLRFWESPRHFVVLGYGNKAAIEANLDACRADDVPVLRRCSGGGTVVQGPGCLNYTLILEIESGRPLDTITETNCYIMQRHRAALEKLTGTAVEIQGHTDLAISKLKFSGNAQRRKRSHLIFHGTFLHSFDLAILERLLPLPSRQPDYRQHRGHEQFLTNLNVPAEHIKDGLRKLWNADVAATRVPDVAALVSEKYSRDDWNLKF